MKPLLTFLVALYLGLGVARAQEDPMSVDSTTAPANSSTRFYIGTALDGLIFSTARIDLNGTQVLGSLRFTAFLNIGATFNLDFSHNFGAYTGIDIKNVGFAMDDNVLGGTAKYRTYNVGIPIGMKIGNMDPRRFYMFLGGGADFPIQYKEKHYASQDQKTKFSEWFSGRVPVVMPYAFIGVSFFRAITVKVQYYPTNFFKSDFVVNGTKPYDNFNVNLLLFSLGSSLPLHRKTDIVTRQVTTLKRDRQ